MSSPAILSDIRKALARSCLAAFVRYTMPGYRMGWVHEEICSELDAFLADVVAGRSPRLMLTTSSVTWATSPRSCNCLIKLLLAIKISMYITTAPLPVHAVSRLTPWAVILIYPSFQRATPPTCPRA